MCKMIFLFSLFIGFVSNAQIVKGVVSDNNGPLPQVNISVKGTSTSTVTDFDGNFTINNLDLNAVLIFSYTGYITQEVAFLGKTNLLIVLKENINSLDEVIVVGYASQKKSSITGAVSTINIETLGKSVSPYISQSLQGLAAGVTVTANTGAPGEGAQIRIRGVGSITGNNSPIYIVDGVQTQNAMDYLSSEDIESMSVLKDAASAAIYGSRANNGVVIITTKKGKKGQATKITYNSDFGIQSHGKLTKMASTQEYVKLYNEAADNDNALLPEDQAILYRKKISPELAATLPNVDHLASIFREAPMQRHHIGVSFGTEKTTVNLSGSYFNQDGILLNSSYKRVNGKIGLNTEVKSWLSIGLNLNVFNDKNNIVGSSGDGFGGNGGSAIRYAFFRSPAIPIYGANGDYLDLSENSNFFGDGYNPVGLLENQDNVRKNFGVFGDVNFKINFTKDLFLVSTFGIDKSNAKQNRFNKNWGTKNRINNPNSLVVSSSLISNISSSNVLNYKHDFNEVHHFNGFVGTERVEDNSERVDANDRDFIDQNGILVQLGNGKGIKTNSESKNTSILLSYFAKANYDYDSKYFLSAVIRRDGSSRFKEGNRWGTFYSGSLGWRIDKDFLKNSEVVEKWMLRLGYGSVGNQQIPNFAYSSRIGTNFNYPFGGINQQGNAVISLGNELLQWETSNQIDMGTDISFLKGKLEFTFDFYQKTTENQLLGISIPSSLGNVAPPILNAGKVLNRGYELDVKYNSKSKGSFSYALKANAALLHNEVLELNSPILAGRIDNSVYATKTEVGQPIGSFFLYEQEGIFQNATDIFTHAFQGNNIRPGDVKYKDQNGDGIISDLDRKHLGSAIPKVSYGFTAELYYKNFDVSLFISGASGQKIYNQINTDIEGFYRPFNVTQRYIDERWTGEGTSNTQPLASWTDKSNNTKPSTRFLEDGSFIRLKNIQLGYSVSKKIIEKFNISKVRFYISASNLFTLTKYTGLDPEFSTNDNSKSDGDLAAGIDYATYPNAIVIQSGFQITF